MLRQVNFGKCSAGSSSSSSGGTGDGSSSTAALVHQEEQRELSSKVCGCGCVVAFVCVRVYVCAWMCWRVHVQLCTFCNMRTAYHDVCSQLLHGACIGRI